MIFNFIIKLCSRIELYFYLPVDKYGGMLYNKSDDYEGREHMVLVTNYLYQLLFTVGVIAVFGLLISLIRRAFCALLGGAGNILLLITGVVGTPVHEFSHAVACLLFGHKINEVKLYSPSRDGSLGYVDHSYNKKNLYHQIGNFFISVAPIIGGSIFLIHLMMLTVPDIYASLKLEIGALRGLTDGGIELSELPGIGPGVWNIFLTVFDFSRVGDAFWWIFIVLAIMVSSHMELSGSDVKGALKGFLFLAGLLFAVDLVLFLFFAELLGRVTALTMSIGVVLSSLFLPALIFCLLLLLLALIVRGVLAIFGR